jgi:uncharacterized membrane protein
VTGDVLLFLGAALASGVEMIEALTIVLALGTVRGWRSPLVGAAAACAVLAVLVAVLGPALEAVPLDTLRLVVGALLLVFGLQWLRKAILRAGGYRALHDEDRLFREEIARARAEGGRARRLDTYAFVLSFKSVVLEGLEVAFIVLTLGANQGSTGLAAAGAAAALVAVVAAGAAVRKPLSRVPENAIKFAVGVMLTSFGTFWAGEGAGADWPGEDLALLALVLVTTGWSLLFVRLLRASRTVSEPAS